MTEEVTEKIMDYYERFLDFIRNYRDESGRIKYIDRIRRMILFNKSSLIVEYPDLYRYDPDLAQSLIDEPDKFLRSASKAIEEVVAQENPDYLKRKKRFVARIVNLYETVKIRDIKSEYIGKMIQVEGIITRMLPVKSKLIRAVFRHSKCGAEFFWPESEDEVIGEKLEKPPICPVCGESGGVFTLVKEKSIYVDYQRVVVQERPEDVPGGQMPRSIEVELSEDLVDTARPGDRVSIVGIVRLQQTSSKSPLFDLYIEANSIRVSEKELEEVSITREDEEKIKELARDPWIRERIISSIAPSIYGHWDLKEAIALLLFGGVPKVKPDGTRIRGDIHVLFIGDPGMAKSQLLQAASRIAPRAVFTTGKGSTAAGLTAAVLRDAKTGEYYLEAGALVLADGGVAIIDEIDKMRNEDRVAIHEAMEQQVISISKAGIVARLNARTSVLAAGNPKFGIYDPSKPFVDNVNLPPTILSRFDLIFVLRDVPEKNKDMEMARYIIETHTDVEKVKPEIEPQLLRKYIMYARRYVRPKISEAARNLIVEFFTHMRASALSKLREGSSGIIPIPITARQLEALIRLTEAHARMALKEEATEEDAAEAIRLTLSFLRSVGFDVETGTFDVGAIMTGATLGTRRIMSVLLEIIKEIEKSKGRCATLKEILDEAKRKKLPEEKVREALNKMHQNGLIYEVRTDCFKST
jgi:replicative DNA helicase Mcm